MQKVLIANRGEIAVRVIRACHDLGLQTVAVYSKADAHELHVHHADEAICIGQAPPAHSYLKRANILAACEITGADAIHPGYGFLSESARFASICESCGLRFIGPRSETIALLGDKARAKQLARSLKIPTLPDSDGPVDDHATATLRAAGLGYPLLVKAVAGGGGRGIRLVQSPDDLASEITAARQEAQISFGNPAVYLEKYLSAPRHVEVQVIADAMGNSAHLGDRDCTVQRRRQKLLEEAPSPAMSSTLRAKVLQDALLLLNEVGYRSLGTVEFLLDDEGGHYFMEVNTRAQVEHTVTEEITGIDLISEQIKLAAGDALSFSQDRVQIRGHAIQMRINAENPERGFQPAPGKIEYYLPSGGPNVRVDSACYSGCIISPHYDSMIAKLIVRGRDREHAIHVGRRALSEFHIGGIASTLSVHREILRDRNFLDVRFDLNFIEQKFGR